MRVSVGDVFSTLTSYLGSTYVNQFNKFGQSLQVYVQAESQFRLQPDDLLNLYVRSQDGNMVPIGAVAHLSEEVGPPLITLYNLFPSATIIGAPARGASSGQALTAMEQIAGKNLPSGVSYEWTAMSYQEKLTGNQLYYLFGLSVLLVYLCLAGQYESWILPLAVLSAVPLALLGPVVALTSLGVANNLYTQIGLILMIALSAKNGILIVEMAREGRMVHGKPIPEAAVDAARLRFRPILMTSFAFGLGVVPVGARHRSRGEWPDFAGPQRVERHHRLDLSRRAVRPLLLRRVARIRGAPQGAEESPAPRRPCRGMKSAAGFSAELTRRRLKRGAFGSLVMLSTRHSRESGNPGIAGSCGWPLDPRLRGGDGNILRDLGSFRVRF